MRTLIDFQQNEFSLLYDESIAKCDLEGRAMLCNLQTTRDMAYGCLHVKSGDEEKVAKMIERLFPEIKAYAIVLLKHKSCKGVRSYTASVMIPGYVLIYTYRDMPVSQLLTIPCIIRILKYCGESWYLQDDDLSFAEWIFNHQGTIGVSFIYMEGDLIRIIEGPLKTLQGKIMRIDKRNRNALVSLDFDHQAIKAWLAFEWMVNLNG